MNRDEAQQIVLQCESAQGPDLQAKVIRCPELRTEHDKLHEERRKLYEQNPTPDPVALAKIHAELYERVYMTLDNDYIPENRYLEAKQALEPRNQRNAGRTAEYDWPLVITLAVRALRDIHYSDEEYPSQRKLAAAVAEEYLTRTTSDMKETNSDLRKWCGAVLNGFKDE